MAVHFFAYLNLVVWRLTKLPYMQYYYFIRLMGRKASHVALECTLQSHPNMVSQNFPLQHVFSSYLNFYIFEHCLYLLPGHSWWGGWNLKAYSFWSDKANMWCSSSKSWTRLRIKILDQMFWLLFFLCVYLIFLSFLTDKNHGVILLPEGLIESIPEIYALLQVIPWSKDGCFIYCTF